MRKHSLRYVISARFALLILLTISVISIAANWIINRQFESYMENQQRLKMEDIVQTIENHHSAVGDGWNLDYVHGIGMYALNDGFIIKLYDEDENVLWDAENHDMTMCHEVMQSIAIRMQGHRPDLAGDFLTQRYELTHSDDIIGYLDIRSYAPYTMDEIDFKFIRSLFTIMLLIGAASLLGAVVMGTVLANGIVRPFDKIIDITKRISDGDYSARLRQAVHTTELHDLKHAVNQMAESLNEQDTLRKQLTSDVAHELRTPVANLSSYIEMMIEGVLEPNQERLQTCYEELQRLSGLIADLEQLRHVEQDLILQRSDVDLRELSETVLGSFESQVREKDLNATVIGEKSVASIDRNKMQQVIANLVSNAIKYTNPGGRIQIKITDGKDFSTIHVVDNGIGIAVEDYKRIFERFYRTDASRNRRTGGAGIGLTIVKAIVQAHHGTVEVESELDKGSVFTVVLPK